MARINTAAAARTERKPYQYPVVSVTSEAIRARQANRSPSPSGIRLASSASTGSIGSQLPATTNTRQAPHCPAPRQDRPIGNRARNTARSRLDRATTVTTRGATPDKIIVAIGTAHILPRPVFRRQFKNP